MVFPPLLCIKIQEASSIDTITSVQNPIIKKLLLLHKKNERYAKGLFLIEGEKLVNEALAAGVIITTVLLDKSKEISSQLLNKLKLEQIRIILSNERVISRLSDTKTPQGLVAVCKIGSHDINQLPPKGKYVILDRIQDPGNLGTIIRTAEAMGIDAVISCGGADIYNPKVVRSTMGSVFRQKVFLSDNTETVIKFLLNSGFYIFAAALTKNSRSLLEISIPTSCAFVIGNEGNGISPSCIALCHESIIIPMKGQTESLNAAIATSIIMWEMSK